MQKLLLRYCCWPWIFIDKTVCYTSIDDPTWHNKWNAAGKEITWDMIHYDVQLIGGMVLHEGKVAEMQTG
jgi:preprotein translocase subunit SecA